MDFREENWSERMIAALRGRPVPLPEPVARAEGERLRKLLVMWLGRVGIVLFILSLPWGLSGCATTQAPPQELGEPLVVRDGNSYVRLGRAPCGHLPGFFSGDSMLDGKTYQLCWRGMSEPGPHILVVFEDGDVRRVEPTQFKPESQVPAPGV